MKHAMTTTTLLAVLLWTPAPEAAESPEERGLAIVSEADRRDVGFGDEAAHLTMVLRNRQGDESTRFLRVRILEVQGDGDKSLSVFEEPLDVKGTALLSFSHKVGADDQWLYLPALKRVKRIASSDKSGSFLGSEFAYEDIASQEIEKYTYRYVGDEEREGEACFVVERRPLDKNSGYRRQLVWFDKAEYRPQKIDYYDRKDALLKTLTFRSYEKSLERYWRAGEMLMVNHQSGKSTLLRWRNRRLRTGQGAGDFTQQALARSR